MNLPGTSFMHWLTEKSDREVETREKLRDKDIREKRKQSEVHMMYCLDEWKWKRKKWRKKILFVWINKSGRKWT